MLIILLLCLSSIALHKTQKLNSSSGLEMGCFGVLALYGLTIIGVIIALILVICKFI